MSNKPKLTPAQDDAIGARGSALLVSAAAGSGKTYTLTQRIIKAIIEEGRDLSRMLIVTFTRAAASDLKAKISKALGEAIASHPENAHLQKQLIMLGSASICTIDSFFSAPVRANFEKLGLPASIRLADEAELDPLRERMMQETIDLFFEKNGGFSSDALSAVGYRTDFTDLLGIISAARDNSNLIPTLTDLYKKLITSPEGIGQLKKHAVRLKYSATLPFFDTDEGKVWKDELESLATYAKNTFLSLINEMKSNTAVYDKYIGNFQENLEMSEAMALSFSKSSYNAVRDAFAAYQPSRLKTMPKDLECELSLRCKNTRTDINGEIKDAYAKYFPVDESEIPELFEKSGRLCVLLCDILFEFERRYSEEKLLRGICEFSDMPRFMMTLLQSPDGEPTEYARSLAAEYDEVYVDEYQDVNEIQDTIFKIIGGDRRFMVGDIKQSIYGFREAEPSIFADYREKFDKYDKNIPPSGKGRKIFMSENFRCDENVIDFSNLVCAPIFTAFKESIGYTSEDDLVFSKTRDENYTNPEVRINILQKIKAKDSDEPAVDEEAEDKNPETLADEATVVANEIAELLKTAKNEKGERLSPSEICILVRSHSTTKPLLRALEKMNVNYAVSSKSEIFDGKDMRILIDLLSVIDNPHADIPLCSLMTTETERVPRLFSTKETVILRKWKNKDSDSLFDAVIRYGDDGENEELKKRCIDFVAFVEQARSIAAKTSADKLIRAISSLERYAPLCETDAYTYLYDSACRYTLGSWNGLYGFLKYFKALMEKGESGADPKVGGNDAVSIMSIHQSKGLEFNTCFLFGFGKRFNLADSKSPLLFTKKFGVSLKLPPRPAADPIEALRSRFMNNPLWLSADILIKEKQVEEEARILYVALTRARVRLYLSATLQKDYDSFSSELINSPDYLRAIKQSKQYIKWVLLSLFHNKNGKTPYSIKVFTRGEVNADSPLDKNMKMGSGRKMTDDDIALTKAHRSARDISEEEKLLASVPSKVAASKVSKTMLDDSVFIPIPTGDLFSVSDEDAREGLADNAERIKARIELMRSKKTDFDSLLEVNKKPTASERGTATHLFLQYCDFERTENEGIESEIARLRSERFISERNASIIDRDQLSGFFKSELFAEIRKARAIRREFRFGMFRAASDFTENEGLKPLVGDKKIYVQGSIDLIIEREDGSIILCDYKTDKVTAEEKADASLLAEHMRDRHGNQMEQYRFAVKEIFGKEPDTVYIYSVPMGCVVEL